MVCFSAANKCLTNLLHYKEILAKTQAISKKSMYIIEIGVLPMQKTAAEKGGNVVAKVVYYSVHEYKGGIFDEIRFYIFTEI